MLETIFTLIGAFVQWVVYTVLLWFMLKIQKLNYNVLGLLGSSALATLIGLIPVVGTYLGWAALVICLWKVTGADIAPDVLFTVGIAGALMFCFNLFLLGTMMGEIRPDLVLKARESVDSENRDVHEEGDDEPDDAPSGKRSLSSPAMVRNEATVSSPNGIVLKGVALKASSAMAMIHDGARLHTLGTGEVFIVHSPQGRMKYRCLEITDAAVLVSDEQGEKFRLQVKAAGALPSSTATNRSGAIPTRTSSRSSGG